MKFQAGKQSIAIKDMWIGVASKMSFVRGVKDELEGVFGLGFARMGHNG